MDVIEGKLLIYMEKNNLVKIVVSCGVQRGCLKRRHEKTYVLSIGCNREYLIEIARRVSPIRNHLLVS